MTEQTDPADRNGILLAREVIGALPPLDREDEAIAAVIEGMLAAAELLQGDEITTTES